MPERRTPVMILVEASWEDQNGILETVSGRMEDRSAGGACLRLKTRVQVGARLGIQWRWEQFTGIARYCRREGNEYVVGIERETAENAPRPVARSVPWWKSARRSNPPAPTVNVPLPPPPQLESKPSEIPPPRREVQNAPIVFINICAPAAPERPAEYDNRTGSRTPRHNVATARPPAQPEQAGKERKLMLPKWLDKKPWSSKPESPVASSGLSSGARADENRDLDAEKENRMSQLTPPAKNIDAIAEEVPSFEVELAPMEDIYRTAGIMVPRKGYSIKKVVEMLNSEHIRNLTKDMKRVAVLMALDAAGVPIAEVLQDAKSRQQALDAHEAEQKKRAEAEWSRKLEENAQIEAELERIKAHHMARINRNLEAVAREKATFNSWQTLKQQESQSMAEAAELCLKAPAADPPAAAPAEASAPKALAKTV
jgi:hypothetical protein